MWIRIWGGTAITVGVLYILQDTVKMEEWGDNKKEKKKNQV